MEKETRGAERQDLPPVGGISRTEDAELAQNAGAPLGEATDQKKRDRIRGENRPAE